MTTKSGTRGSVSLAHRVSLQDRSTQLPMGIDMPRAEAWGAEQSLMEIECYT